MTDAKFHRRALTVGAGLLFSAQLVLARHCDSTVLSMMQHVAQGEACEHVYQVHMRRHARREMLISELGAVPGVSDLSLMLEDSRVEP